MSYIMALDAGTTSNRCILLARIEVPAEEILKIADNETRTKITEKFHTLGFSYVTLDLQGFRSGSMNETLEK